MRHEQSLPASLDLREVPAEERRLRVLSTFGHLHPGDTLLLTHSHPSNPLRYLLLAEAPRAFTWQYLEEGPQTWRICIRKTLQPLAAGCDRGARQGRTS